MHLLYIFRRTAAPQMGGLFSDLLPLALARYLISLSCDEGGLPRLAEFDCRGPRGRCLPRIWPSTAGQKRVVVFQVRWVDLRFKGYPWIPVVFPRQPFILQYFA
jgi:hypothetical protein